MERNYRQEMFDDYADIFDFQNCGLDSPSVTIVPPKKKTVDELYEELMSVDVTPKTIDEILFDFGFEEPTIIIHPVPAKKMNFTSCVALEQEAAFFSLTGPIETSLERDVIEYGFGDHTRNTIACFYDVVSDRPFIDFGSGETRYCDFMNGQCVEHVDIKNMENVRCKCGRYKVPRIVEKCDCVISVNTIQILSPTQLRSLLLCGAKNFKFVYPKNRNDDEYDPMHVLRDYKIKKHGLFSRFFNSSGKVGNDLIYTELDLELTVTGLFLDKKTFIPKREVVDNVSVFLLCVRDGKLFCVKKGDSPHVDFVAGGKVERGETITQALDREIKEEMGIVINYSYLGYSDGAHSKGFVFYYVTSDNLEGIKAKEDRGFVVEFVANLVLRYDMMIAIPFLIKRGLMHNSHVRTRIARTCGINQVPYSRLTTFLADIKASRTFGVIMGLSPLWEGEKVQVNAPDGFYDYQYSGRRQAIIRVEHKVGVALEVEVPVRFSGGALVSYSLFDFDGERMFFSGSPSSVKYLKKLYLSYGINVDMERAMSVIAKKEWIDISEEGLRDSLFEE